jgi:AcrR family transcriptional regulator
VTVKAEPTAHPRPTASGAGPRRGRPRSQERERDILAAAVVALVEEGYDAMTMEGVAAAAGAGKATIYRRWKSKAELVVDAIREHVAFDIELVDTGDIRADMHAFLVQLRNRMLGPDGRLLATFMAERLRHPALAEMFDRRFVSEKRVTLRGMVQRAVAGGDLPADTDVDLLVDVGKAIMVHEFTQHGGKLRRDLPERIVRQFLPPSH